MTKYSIADLVSNIYRNPQHIRNLYRPSVRNLYKPSMLLTWWQLGEFIPIRLDIQILSHDISTHKIQCTMNLESKHLCATVSVPPFLRHRYGATVLAPTVSMLGLYGAGIIWCHPFGH